MRRVQVQAELAERLRLEPVNLDYYGVACGLDDAELETPILTLRGSLQTAVTRKGGIPMKLRLWLVLAACVLGGLILAGTAAADPPTREERSAVGDQFVCGETILTATSGTLVTRSHEHELPNGRFRVIFIEVPKGVTLTDAEGTVYRAVGRVHGNFTTPDPDAEGGEVGTFSIRVNFLGPGGLFGTVDFRLRVNRNGEETVRDRGTCELVEP
jgi:hypothetical protein